MRRCDAFPAAVSSSQYNSYDMPSADKTTTPKRRKPTGDKPTGIYRVTQPPVRTTLGPRTRALALGTNPLRLGVDARVGQISESLDAGLRPSTASSQLPEIIG